MVTIIFESHGTTYDNEDKLSSGWYDVELSSLGQEQARQLGERYALNRFTAIFCSDLRRSYKTAEIAFAGKNIPIIKDERLRECNYGELNRRPSAEVDPVKLNHITEPFPGGESYEQTSVRMKDFLQEVSQKYEGQTVLVIGHRATQYGLEHWINHVALKDAVAAPWQWQPGWTYSLRN